MSLLFDFTVPESFIEHDAPHHSNPEPQQHNYYIVIGVLAGALSVAMSIIAICVCWLQKGTNPRKIQPISGGDDDRYVQDNYDSSFKGNTIGRLSFIVFENLFK